MASVFYDIGFQGPEYAEDPLESVESEIEYEISRYEGVSCLPHRVRPCVGTLRRWRGRVAASRRLLRQQRNQIDCLREYRDSHRRAAKFCKEACPPIVKPAPDLDTKDDNQLFVLGMATLVVGSIMFGLGFMWGGEVAARDLHASPYNPDNVSVTSIDARDPSEIVIKVDASGQ